MKTLKTMLASAFAGAIILAASAPAQAQRAPCGPTDRFLRHLETKYKETIRFSAPNTQGTFVFQITASESGSWSFIRTDTKGATCIITGGQGFELIEPKFRYQSLPKS